MAVKLEAVKFFPRQRDDLMAVLSTCHRTRQDGSLENETKINCQVPTDRVADRDVNKRLDIELRKGGRGQPAVNKEKLPICQDVRGQLAVDKESFSFESWDSGDSDSETERVTWTRVRGRTLHLMDPGYKTRPRRLGWLSTVSHGAPLVRTHGWSVEEISYTHPSNGPDITS